MRRIYPESKDQVLKALDQWHNWLALDGAEGNYPVELDKIHNSIGWINLFFTITVHALLFAVSKFANSVGIWSLAAFSSYIRIKTDRWSMEPRQCGYNRAYTLLGLYRLKKKNISGAVDALVSSWHVWPCPHSTSFGLCQTLAEELDKYKEAEIQVKEYREIARKFVS